MIPTVQPYRGLEPLEAEDAGIFFGRDGPTIIGLDLLRGLREAAAPRLLVILGASGAGKSSFLRAGLLPRLARESQHFLPLPVIRPERAVLSGEAGLVASLERALKAARLARTRADIRKAIVAGPANIASLLKDLVKTNTAAHAGDRTRSPKPPTPVLAIDQAEKLFHAEGAEEALTFLDLLSTLVAEDNPPLIVLFTIRSDSYERLQTAVSLQGLRQHMLSLPPLPRGAYTEVIKGPARRLEGAKRALKIEEFSSMRYLPTSMKAAPKMRYRCSHSPWSGSIVSVAAAAASSSRTTRRWVASGGSIEAAVGRALRAADSAPKIPRDRQARLALLRRGLIPWLAGIDPDTGSPRRRLARLSEIPRRERPSDRPSC